MDRHNLIFIGLVVGHFIFYSNYYMSLGSLCSFIPDLSFSNTKALLSPKVNSITSLNLPSHRRSAKSLNLSLNLSFSNTNIATSKGGYNFSSTIKESQRKVFTQTARKKKSSSFIQKPRINTSKSSINSKKSLTLNPKFAENPAKNEINIFEESIRHELQMKNNHYLVRTMKKLKVDGEIGKGSYMSRSGNNRFSELAMGLMNIPTKAQTTGKSERNSSYKPINLTTAKEKLHQFRVNSWIHKSSREIRKSLGFFNFILEFFNELDTQKSGTLNGEKLVESLVYLGLASDPSIIRRTLCLIYKCKDLVKLKIRVKDFTELFKNDPKTDKILEKLDELCRNSKAKEEYCIKVGECKGNAGNDKDLRASNGFKVEKKRMESITINEHLDIIGKWWKSIDKSGMRQVEIEDVVDFFTDMSIAKDKNDAKSLIISQIGAKRELNSDDFQQIFAKSMLKAAFLNLSKRLSDQNFAVQDISPGFKLQTYKKSLLMSGIKCKTSEISEEEGQKALRAIEKYNSQRKTVEKCTYEEIKQQMLKILGLSQFEYLKKCKEDGEPQEKEQETESVVNKPMAQCFYIDQNPISPSESFELPSPTLDKDKLYRRETYITYRPDEKYLNHIKALQRVKKKSATDAEFFEKYHNLINNT